jgi:hypothetical protein
MAQISQDVGLWQGIGTLPELTSYGRQFTEQAFSRMKVAASFSGRWTSFFATTYSLELEFFDEYLFRRLGEPPLNATVLTDADTHARLWTSGDQTRRLRRANLPSCASTGIQGQPIGGVAIDPCLAYHPHSRYVAQT